jgi:hypothetical protein
MHACTHVCTTTNYDLRFCFRRCEQSPIFHMHLIKDMFEKTAFYIMDDRDSKWTKLVIVSENE